MKVHSGKSMNVSDEKVTDEDGLLSRSMMIKANNTIMKERIWINRVASKIVFQPGIQTMALRYTMSVCAITVREEPNLHVNPTRRCHRQKRSGEWLNTESRNLVFDSRCVNLFKEFKTARPSVSYTLKVNEFADLDNQ